MTCLILLCTTLVSKVIIALSAHLLVDILRSLADDAVAAAAAAAVAAAAHDDDHDDDASPNGGVISLPSQGGRRR